MSNAEKVSAGTATEQRERKPPGRKKGVPNKLTRDVKAAIEAAFDKVGGVEYLVRQAEQNPQAFLTLLAKVLPKDVTITPSEGFTIEVKL